MMEESSNRPRETAAPMKTPGELLRTARLLKNLSTSDIAKQLRLNHQWVLDIEANRYARAAALIYVRGYLRLYAQIVDVPVDQLMAAFEALNPEEQFLRERANEKIVKHQTVPIVSRSARLLVSRPTIRWAAAVVMGLLIILGGVWWQEQKKHGIEAVPVAAQSAKKELVIQGDDTMTAAEIASSSTADTDSTASTPSPSVPTPNRANTTPPQLKMPSPEETRTPSR